MEKSKATPQVIASLSATLTIVTAGINGGWSSPFVSELLSADSPIPITSGQSSLIVSCLWIGCICGTVIGCNLPDRWGRKRGLLCTAIVTITGWTFVSFAQNYVWLCVARIFAGMGTGISYTILPMYLGEIADDSIRGMLAAIINQMYNVGVLFAYCIGPWLDIRVFAGVAAAVPLLLIIIFVWMPESPYYLVMKNKTEDARKSLEWLRGTRDVDEVLKTIELNVELDQRNPSTFREMIVTSGNRKAISMSVGLIIAEQFSGITAILSYSTIIVQESGSEMNTSISVIILGVIQLLSGILTLCTVDLAGRRPLLLISSFGVVISLSAEAVYFQLKELGIDVSSINWLPVTGLVFFLIFYTMGLGALPFVIFAEIFPCNIKAKGCLVSNFCGALCGVIVTQIYQIMSDAYGIHSPFWFFAGITFLFGICIFFFLPETKQKSFRDIQRDLRRPAAVVTYTFEMT